MSQKPKGLMRQLITGDMGKEINELLSEGKDALKSSKEDLPKLKTQMDFIENALMIFILIEIGNLGDTETETLRKELIEKINKRVSENG